MQALVRAVQCATRCTGVKVQQNNGPVAGQTVPQLHFHIIPCYGSADQQQIRQRAAPAPAAPAAVTVQAVAAPEPPAAAAVAASAPDNEQRQQQEQEQEQLQLLAGIRNHLPPAYNPGGAFHCWVGSTSEMEALGAVLQQVLVPPGSVVLMEGQLGAGKSTIARGFVRAFCKDPSLDVPSPTYLLCLSYTEDLAHDKKAAAPAAVEAAAAAAGGSADPAAEQQQQEQQQRPVSVHHMDPYRLGQKAERMAGVIDFSSAFAHDICLIEWPDRMPASVMQLPKKGISLQISGTGIQSAGRLVTITPLTPDDPSATILARWRASGLPQPTNYQPTAADSAAADGQQPSSSSAAATAGASGAQAALAAALAAKAREEWVVLGIESSCDDTAAAVVRGDGTVLAHCIASQTGLHEVYGGVKPDVARDAHAAAITSTVESCLTAAGVTAADLSAVAVTVGPGLSLCLQVGMRKALQLASAHNKPLVPIHHMEAHAMVTRMPQQLPAATDAVAAAASAALASAPSPVQFPALLLLVSGGHNMLVLTEGIGRHRIIGTTLDDSVGECFDKTARLLGISAIPGGPLMEKLAAEGRPGTHKFTMPMQTGQHKDTCNFSFSGLKTAVGTLVAAEKERLGLTGKEVRLAVGSGPAAAAAAPPADQSAARKRPRQEEGDAGEAAATAAPATAAQQQQEAGAAEGEIDPQTLAAFRQAAADIAASFQATAVKILQQRAQRALKWLQDDSQQHRGPMVQCVVVAGGVAANAAVRAGMEKVASEFGLPAVFPPLKLCSDNGVMVAWTGVERLALGLWQPPPAAEHVERHIDVRPRWPLGPVDPRSAAAKQYMKFLH